VGCPIWLDPQVKCGHVGQQIVSEPWYERSLIEIRRLEEMQEKAPA
jgi:hypothetical protein